MDKIFSQLLNQKLLKDHPKLARIRKQMSSSVRRTVRSKSVQSIIYRTSENKEVNKKQVAKKNNSRKRGRSTLTRMPSRNRKDAKSKKSRPTKLDKVLEGKTSIIEHIEHNTLDIEKPNKRDRRLTILVQRSTIKTRGKSKH